MVSCVTAIILTNSNPCTAVAVLFEIRMHSSAQLAHNEMPNA